MKWLRTRISPDPGVGIGRSSTIRSARTAGRSAAKFLDWLAILVVELDSNRDDEDRCGVIVMLFFQSHGLLFYIYIHV